MTKTRLITISWAVVLTTLVVVLLWIQRQSTLMPGPAPSPISIDTSNWVSVRHSFYPFSVKVPPGSYVWPDSLDINYYPIQKTGQSTAIVMDNTQTGMMGIAGDINTHGIGLDSSFDLRQFAICEAYWYKNNSFSPADCLNSKTPPTTPPTEMGIKRVEGNGWEGYEYWFLGTVWRKLLIAHNGIMYKVEYYNDKPLQPAIVQTLRFHTE